MVSQYLDCRVYSLLSLSYTQWKWASQFCHQALFSFCQAHVHRLYQVFVQSMLLMMSFSTYFVYESDCSSTPHKLLLPPKTPYPFFCSWECLGPYQGWFCSSFQWLFLVGKTLVLLEDGDAIVLTVFVKLTSSILFSIKSHCIDVSITLFLNKGLDPLESFKHFWFLLQKIHPTFSWKIINK